MGLFRDSPEEERLRQAVNSLAHVAAMADDGRATIADLRDVLDCNRLEVRELYDAVCATRGPRAARKLLSESRNIAALSTFRPNGFGARSLMEQVLREIDRPY